MSFKMLAKCPECNGTMLLYTLSSERNKPYKGLYKCVDCGVEYTANTTTYKTENNTQKQLKQEYEFGFKVGLTLGGIYGFCAGILITCIILAII